MEGGSEGRTEGGSKNTEGKRLVIVRIGDSRVWGAADWSANQKRADRG